MLPSIIVTGYTCKLNCKKWTVNGFFQSEDDMSRESSPCKSPDTAIKEQPADLDLKSSELIGMDDTSHSMQLVHKPVTKSVCNKEITWKVKYQNTKR